jgi:hypothetical protein
VKLEGHELCDALHDRSWPTKAVNLLTSLILSGQRVHELFGITPEELKSFLRNRKPKIATLLESLTATYAQKLGKPRWAEKTPNHLLYLQEIRQAFPEATIIRIVRDPRDCALSMRKLPWASSSILANCHLIDEWFQRSHEFLNHDRKSVSVRFEDLMANRENVLRLICEHIGEQFEESMLERGSGKSVVTSSEPWKHQVTKPLDASRVYAWKRELPKSLTDAATYICRELIEEFGYELRSKPTLTVYTYGLTRSFIAKNEDFLVRVAKLRVHLTREPKNMRKENLLFCSIFLPGRTSGERFFNAGRFAWLLISRRFLRVPNMYLQVSEDSAPGCLEHICVIFLKILGVKSDLQTIKAEEVPNAEMNNSRKL